MEFSILPFNISVGFIPVW